LLDASSDLFHTHATLFLSSQVQYSPFELLYYSSQDLKKQTALRLAQEQQQKQGGVFVTDPNTGRDLPLQPLPGLQLSGHGQFVHPIQSNNGFVAASHHQAGHLPYASPARGVSVMPTPQPDFPSPQPYSYQLPHPIPQNPTVPQTGGYEKNYGNPSSSRVQQHIAEQRQISPRNMQPHAPGRRQVRLVKILDG
jgi:hypothetical protein